MHGAGVAVEAYLQPADLVGYASALFQVVVAAIVLGVGPRDPRHQSLFLMLACNGGWAALIVIWQRAELLGASAVVQAAVAAMTYTIIATNAALAWFLTTYPYRTRLSTGWFPRTLLAATLVLCAAFAIDARVVLQIAPTVVYGPFYFVNAIFFLLLVFAAVRFVRAATPADKIPRVLALTMLAYPLLAGPSMVGMLPAVADRLPTLAGSQALFYMTRNVLLVVGGIMAPIAAGYVAWRGRMGDSWPWIVAAVAVPLMIAGGLDSGLALGALSMPLWASTTLGFLSDLVFTTMIAYVVLRLRIFDIDRHVVRTAGRALFAGAVAVVFITLTETLERLLIHSSSAVISILGAVAIALSVQSIWGMTQTVTQRLEERTRLTPDAAAERKQRIYIDARRAMALRGRPTGEMSRAMARLRRQLDLPSTPDDVTH